MKHDLEYLLELMDDDNEQSACMAMAEILAGKNENLENRLCELQESSDPRLRRRVHQLQSALGIRKKRYALADGFHASSLPLVEGLIQLHLLWFDNDLRESMIDQLEELLEEFRTVAPVTLERIGYFMRKKGFYAPPNNNVEAEYFCIGTVLEDTIGSDVLLCSIAMITAASARMSLKVIRYHSEFALMDDQGNLLLPSHDWKYIPASENTLHYHLADTNTILRFVGASLFAQAAATDSFRYIYTIGNCLADSKEELDFLPYPYNTAKRRK